MTRLSEQKYYLRDEIGKALYVLGKKYPKIVAITADLVGTCRLQDFYEAFPERSFNVGIAEQNMVSFAAGMAHEGFMPYVFSMAPFISMRACEQCRTDVAYAGVNVRLMGTYAGYSGGISGATHWALEDCAIMGGIPGMTVLEPSDPIQVQKMMDATVDYDGPVYMRSTVEPVSMIYKETYEYQIGKASVPVEGTDGAVICSGVVVQYAVKAAEILRDIDGIRLKVIDMHTIKPIDKMAVEDAAQTGLVIVAQDHNICGGLGYNVANALAQMSLSPKFAVLGCEDRFVPMAHALYLYQKNNYEADGIVRKVRSMIKERETNGIAALDKAEYTLN